MRHVKVKWHLFVVGIYTSVGKVASVIGVKCARKAIEHLMAARSETLDHAFDQLNLESEVTPES